MARQRGRINLFAGLAAKGWAEIEANLIHYKELEVTGSANSRRADYQNSSSAHRVRPDQGGTDGH